MVFADFLIENCCGIDETSSVREKEESSSSNIRCGQNVEGKYTLTLKFPFTPLVVGF